MLNGANKEQSSDSQVADSKHPPLKFEVPRGFTRPFHMLIIELAVGLMVLQAIAINRIAGIKYPLWSPQIKVAS